MPDGIRYRTFRDARTRWRSPAPATAASVALAGRKAQFLAAVSGALDDTDFLTLLLLALGPPDAAAAAARTLIARFGTFAKAAAADPVVLRTIPGVGEDAIFALKLAPVAALRLLRADIVGRSVLSSGQAVIDYCRAAAAGAPREQFRLLFLNRKNVVIADEVQQEGTVDHAPVYPREVVRRALEVGASALILVHNHPSGDPTPSAADIAMTRAIAAAAKTLDIALHDHIVIGGAGHVSFRAAGLLP